MRFYRHTFRTLQARLDEVPRFLIVVAGPRQVGKTTLVEQVLDGRPSTFVRADQPVTRLTTGIASSLAVASAPASAEWLRERWNEARAQTTHDGRAYVLAIDEIQKIPRWSDIVKGLWDEDRANRTPLHVVILGSSPWLMQKGLSESLAGRFEMIRMAHWAYAEMQEAFDVSLEEYIYFGGYPGSAHMISDEQRWRQYLVRSLIHPMIDKDILEAHRINKPAVLRNLFEIGCGEYSGQIISFTKLLGQLQDAGNTTTLSHYLELLGQAGMLSGITKYAGKMDRQRASIPKLNVHNTALFSAQSRYNFEQARQDRTHWGRLVESTVGAHLLNTLDDDMRLHYWREGNDEVDFVVVRGKQLAAIEVKSGRRTGVAKGLSEFAKAYPAARTITVGDGYIPLQEFLTRPAEAWL
jgi:uncharacterized protein